jgi:hypothetical protein
MKTHRKKPKYTNIPQKPELEITSSAVIEEDETIHSNAFEDLANDADRTSLGNIDTSTNSLTAPIRMPNRDQLAVDMVPSSLVYQYDEYRSDESKMAAFFFAFLGAFLGVIINWATADSLIFSKTSIIIEVILFLIVLIMGYFTYVFDRRAKNKKLEIDKMAKK